ncbi:hypothetical protein [Nocardia lasii]|uniref:Uncharacterized protein n=1 Tax=Nocardia lasii TaxID=1616107 RepID=A0ABW1JMI7_9NOCA
MGVGEGYWTWARWWRADPESPVGDAVSAASADDSEWENALTASVLAWTALLGG